VNKADGSVGNGVEGSLVGGSTPATTSIAPRSDPARARLHYLALSIIRNGEVRVPEVRGTNRRLWSSVRMDKVEECREAGAACRLRALSAASCVESQLWLDLSRQWLDLASTVETGRLYESNAFICARAANPLC
jgi:hypothetical protein